MTKFSEVAVGTKFVLNAEEYTKIEPEKVSCCKTNNALKLSDNSKLMVKPDTDVEVAE